jgi:hypothetical protein
VKDTSTLNIHIDNVKQTCSLRHPPETPLTKHIAPKPDESVKEFYGLMLRSSRSASDYCKRPEIPIERSHALWKLAHQNTTNFDILLRVDGPWLDTHVEEEDRKPTMWTEFFYFLGVVEKSPFHPWWFDRLAFPG